MILRAQDLLHRYSKYLIILIQKTVFGVHLINIALQSVIAYQFLIFLAKKY